ncbi:hypothetical protein HDV00_000255 [Rhizophlyctis rosea]|nr:hypothetical protein HDV00_000255 [Rhizophlyctis rosea]
MSQKAPAPYSMPTIAHLFYSFFFAGVALVQTACFLSYGDVEFKAGLLLLVTLATLIAILLKIVVDENYGIHLHIGYVLVTLVTLVVYTITFCINPVIDIQSADPVRWSMTGQTAQLSNLSTFSEFRFLCYCQNAVNPIASTVHFIDGLTVRNASANLGTVHAPGGDTLTYKKLTDAVPEVNPTFNEHGRDKMLKILCGVMHQTSPHALPPNTKKGTMSQNQLVLYTKLPPTPKLDLSFAAHIMYTGFFTGVGLVQTIYLLSNGDLGWALTPLMPFVALCTTTIALNIKSHFDNRNIHIHNCYNTFILTVLLLWMLSQPTSLDVRDFQTKDTRVSASIVQPRACTTPLIDLQAAQPVSWTMTGETAQLFNLSTLTEFRFLCYCQNVAHPVASSTYFTDGLTVRNASADLGTVRGPKRDPHVPVYWKLEAAVPDINPGFTKFRRDRVVGLSGRVVKWKVVFDTGLFLWAFRKGTPQEKGGNVYIV